MFYLGVLPGPIQSLKNRGRCCCHQPAAPGGHAAGGRKFQHQPGRTRGTRTGRGYCSGHGIEGTGGHERPLTPTAQDVVEGRTHMGHTPGRPEGALLDQLHPGHIQSSVLENSSLGIQA